AGIQLVVRRPAAFAIDQVVALAAQVPGFYYESSPEFALEVGVPLLDDRVRIVVEEAVADPQPQIRIVAAGGSVRAPARQVETVRERVAESGCDRLKPIVAHDHIGRGLEAFRAAAAGGPGCLQDRAGIQNAVRAAEN